MSIPLLQLAGIPVLERLLMPGFLAVCGLAGVATFLLYTKRPRLSRRAVVALVPWMVAAAGLSVLARAAQYPDRIEPAVSGLGAYLTTYVVVCLAWFAILELRANRDDRDAGLATLLAAMGAGMAMVIVGSLLLGAGSLSGALIFWLAVAPIAAAAAAGLVLLLLGLWYPEAAAYTGAVGGVVVFGYALWAIGSAVTVLNGPGGHTSLSWAVLELVASLGLADRVGVDQQLVWAWGFVWVKLLVAVVAVLGLTAYSREHPARGNLALGAIGAVGVIGGVTALLSMAVA